MIGNRRISLDIVIELGEVAVENFRDLVRRVPLHPQETLYWVYARAHLTGEDCVVWLRGTAVANQLGRLLAVVLREAIEAMLVW